MRIAYMSDLHLEHRLGYTPIRAMDYEYNNYRTLPYGPDLRQLKKEGCDLLLLAGDIGGPMDHLDYATDARSYLRCPVVTVPGNHDYYGIEFRHPLFDQFIPVDVLDRREVVHKGVRILGATLWVDFKATGDQDAVMRLAPRVLADFQWIYGMTPARMLEEHQASRKWLLDRLREPFEGKTIVMTHNSPHSAARNKNYPMDDSSACFVSDCNDLIEAAIDADIAAWIYGHDHWSQCVNLGGIKLLSAQKGYPGENTNWDGIGLLEI